MTVSVVTADSVLALTKSTKSLSEEQIKRIQDLLPFMNENDLKMLKAMLEKVRDAEVKDMQREIELRRELRAKKEEIVADEARETLKSKEGGSQQADEKYAESLIQNM